MRVPISWLRDYVDFDLNADELAELITNAGMEVDRVEHLGTAQAALPWDPELVVLGRVLSVRQHPNADRLVIATVDYGKESPKDVVTGAPNLVPFIDRDDLEEHAHFGALILAGGTYLDPYKNGKPTKLKGKELRGVYNDAMLCSAVELGLGEDHDGILLIEEGGLPPGVGHAPGTPLAEVLGDAVLDIDIIPNIARCASVLGVAREVAALTGSSLKYPNLDVLQEGPAIDGRLELATEQPSLNPRFVAYLIEGVEQKPAPFWMQHRLNLAGQRPINVVVDISNYVMLEVGQPNHTFDWDFLQQRAGVGEPVRITTRLAQPDETLTTLDGTEHKLRSNHILVTDPQGNLSIGGVMGGANSEIQPNTTNVLLEAAAWKFTNIRQTQRELSLHTEAGFRFSRGVHPAQALVGARRAAELLRTLAGGRVAAGCVDQIFEDTPAVVIELDPTYINQRSGLNLTSERISELLRRLEFEVVDTKDDRLLVTCPDHRIDLAGQHDLLEEVCRMVGYDQLPSTVLSSALPTQRGNEVLEFEDSVRDSLVGIGLNEVVTYRLTTPEAEQRLGDPAVSNGPWVEVTNPSTRDRAAMRRSLLASVLDIAARNARFAPTLRLFEVGNVFHPTPGNQLPAEPSRLAIVLAGRREPASWLNADDAESLDFFDLKGVLEQLLVDIQLTPDFRAADHPSYRPGRCAEIHHCDQVLGHLGELHPAIAEAWDLPATLCCELDLALVRALSSSDKTVVATPTYPAIREDLAFVLPASTPASELTTVLRNAGGQMLESVQLFDLYEGDKLGAGHKSLAYNLVYRSPQKTLREKDANKLRQRLVRAAEQHLGAKLRQ